MLSYNRAKRYKSLNILMRFIYLFELKEYINLKKELGLFNLITFVSNYDKKFLKEYSQTLKKTKLIENLSNINKINGNLFLKSLKNLYIGNFKSISNLISVFYLSDLINNFKKFIKRK